MSSVDEIVSCGLLIRPHERTIVVDGHEVSLTTGEFDIVMKLVGHPGWVLTPDQLAADDSDIDRSTESVSVLVSRLRHKLAQAGADGCIETVRGIGYRIHALNEASDHQPDVNGQLALRDALVDLIEAVIDAERSGDSARVEAASRALAAARDRIQASTASRGRAR